MTVFWPVCTQISITKANLYCAIQVMVQRCFPLTHLSNHAAKSRYECIDLKIVIWGAELCNLLTTSADKPRHHAFSNRNSISNEIAMSMSVEHRNEPRFFSLLWNANPQTCQSLLSLVCTLGNSNIAITIRHCNFESDLV